MPPCGRPIHWLAEKERTMRSPRRYFPLSILAAALIGAALAYVLATTTGNDAVEIDQDWAADGGGDDAERVKKLKEMMIKLKPLHSPIKPPGPSDWLAQHKEPGQTFKQYLDCRPVTPRGKRNTLYIQPLGPFTKTQRKIIDLTAEFMGIYFNTPVKVSEDLSLKVIPKKAQRVHPHWGMKQILSTYVLDDVLRPRLPKDAAAYIAFTATDLYPEPSWNFVFGMASLRHRVGVWSIYRNGNPDRSEAGFRLCLLRTLKTATHETGHMFSILHCTLYECNMCGSNHRQESDRRPITLCPECLPKVLWSCEADAVDRFRELAAFSKKHGLKDEHSMYTRALKKLGGEADANESSRKNPPGREATPQDKK